ncbi:thermonuclease family protein [Salinithrix halophila]|uniref:Thermonuclease family protein n=1 Tax=Salinithrix halophila TaxID=1485204 RepID=A0ABV8JFY0_9BACL
MSGWEKDKCERVGLALFLGAWMLLAAGCNSHPADNERVKGLTPPPQSNLTDAKVTRVIDGDTIEVKTESGSQEKVRLVGVNTPETNHPKIGVEAYGKEASHFTKRRLAGQDIALETDTEKRDRYGRLLAYVWRGEEMFNATLLKKGMAQMMTVPPNVKYQKTFLQLQREAQKEETGLWEKQGEGPSTGKSSAGEGCKGKIKGNITRSGEEIYHTRKSPQYSVTKPERWFCNESGAKEAGYRPPGRSH